jgi:hypothetical protein
MIKLIFPVALVLSFSSIHAQGELPKPQASTTQVSSPNYILIPTCHQFMYIKLNTQTGQMGLLQFDQFEERQFLVETMTNPQVNENDAFSGRFTLIPTHLESVFLLLDQADGRTWQYIWSVEPKKRSLTLIE